MANFEVFQYNDICLGIYLVFMKSGLLNSTFNFMQLKRKKNHYSNWNYKITILSFSKLEFFKASICTAKWNRDHMQTFPHLGMYVYYFFPNNVKKIWAKSTLKIDLIRQVPYLNSRSLTDQARFGTSKFFIVPTV